MPAEPSSHARPDLYRFLIDHVPVALVQTRPDGQILYHNPRAREMLGYEREDWPYLNAQDLYVNPADRQELIEALEGQGIHHYEYPLRRKDGERLWVRGCSRRVRDETGQEVYFGFLEDITAQKRMQEELHTSQQEMDLLACHASAIRTVERSQLARELARELGSFFKGLKADLAYLQEHLGAESALARDKVESMQRALDRGLQSLFRLTGPSRPEILDRGLPEGLRRLGAEFEQRTGVPVSVHLEQEGLEIDEEVGLELFRSAAELLDNVARHAQARQVEVCLGQREGHWRLEVTDDGRGITREEANSRQTLGLPSLRARVRGWGGAFHIEGVEGHGTRVQVDLPVLSGDHLSPQALDGPRWRLLLVSDPGIVREGLKHILTSASSRIVLGEASTAQEGKDAVWKQSWDAVLLDLSTHGAERLEWLCQVRRERPHLPVLVLGNQGDTHMRRGVQAGAAGVVRGDQAHLYLIQAVEQVTKGEPFIDPTLAALLGESGEAPPHERLSHREYEVFYRLAQGQKVAQMARELSLSPRSIRTYRIRILEKIELNTDAELIFYALRQGLVENL